MVRLAELDVGAFFKVNDVWYIKLDDLVGKNELVLAINKDPQASVDMMKGARCRLDPAQRIFSGISDNLESNMYESSDIVCVRYYAKYKHLIAPHVKDCWYVEWSNKAQGKDGDYCYIDEAGNYNIVKPTDDTSKINGNGRLNVRSMCLFDPDTIVEI